MGNIVREPFVNIQIDKLQPTAGAPVPIPPASSLPNDYYMSVLFFSPDHYWRFGEAPGASLLLDEITPPFNCTHFGVTLGAAGLVSGDANTAIQYGGSIGLVTPSDLFPDIIPSNISFHSIIKDNSGAALRTIIGQYDTDPTRFYFAVNASGNLVYSKGDVDRAVGSTNLRDGNAHHVGFDLNKDTNAITLYVDGVPDGSGTDSTNLFESQRAAIGMRDINDTVFLGIIDEPAIHFDLLPIEAWQHFASFVA